MIGIIHILHGYPTCKKLYSEYDSSILKSEDNNRGKTVIKSILINGDPVIWRRVLNNQDLIELTLKVWTISKS